MQRCNIRISNYVSTIDSKSYKNVVKLLSQGITDPEELIKCIHGRTINKHGRATLLSALTGVVTAVDSDIIRMLMIEINMLEVHKAECQERKITHGNKYLRKTLIECAWAASRTQGSFLNKFSYTQVTVRKKNKMKVQVAIARKILVAIWHMFTKEQEYIDILKIGS